MVLLGALCLIMAGTYFAYTSYQRSQLEELVTATLVSPTAQVAPEIVPEYWDDVYWAESLEDDALIAQFEPVDYQEIYEREGSEPNRLVIPALELDAKVEGLSILQVDDAKQYATPNKVVGHIPESANPGVTGTVWLFGHLESPLRGEGAVFRDLPRVQLLMNEGRRVLVILESDEGRFLYQVREFTKIPEDAFQFTTSDDPLITLVTCWPRFAYDERVLVTAELIGTARVQ
ncbi:sortase [SAR202 cluster bacterium AD-802-E10_MRT_200m]|nr:sortase [SAR202 cluster bacterium AD-802-E10_MRT_200m]